MMCYALFYLGTVFDHVAWKEQSERMVRSMRKMLLQYPSSFGYWGHCFFVHAVGFIELVAIGKNVQNDIPEVANLFLPHKIQLFLPNSVTSIPIISDKQSIDNQYFICKNSTCSTPTTNLAHFLALI